jgi:hypothetical protein
MSGCWDGGYYERLAQILCPKVNRLELVPIMQCNVCRPSAAVYVSIFALYFLLLMAILNELFMTL